MTTTPRTPTAIDKIAEEWVDTLAVLEPTLGTYIGRNDVNDRYGDLSPDGHEQYAAEVRKTLGALDAVSPADSVDEVTKQTSVASSGSTSSSTTRSGTSATST